MDAFKPWQFGKLNKIIYVSRGFYCRIKGALHVAACHCLIRPLDLFFFEREGGEEEEEIKRDKETNGEKEKRRRKRKKREKKGEERI